MFNLTASQFFVNLLILDPLLDDFSMTQSDLKMTLKWPQSDHKDTLKWLQSDLRWPQGYIKMLASHPKVTETEPKANE